MNWRRFFHRNDADSDVRGELASYLEHATEDFIARGMDPKAAREAAHCKLGNTTGVCEEVYRMNTISLLEETARNVRFSVRALRKSPAFAAAAIMTIAIGIGANTAVFSVVDGVLLKPLAYRGPERLVSIRNAAPGLGGVTAVTGLGLSTGMYFTYSEQNRSFENMGSGPPRWSRSAARGAIRSRCSLSGSVRALWRLWVSRPSSGIGFRATIRNPARHPRFC